MKRVTEKCSCCNNKAVWIYIPGGEEKKRKFLENQEYKRSLYCEIHVPRGCSCNLSDVFEYADHNIVNAYAADIENKSVFFRTIKSSEETSFNVSNRKLIQRPNVFSWSENELLEFEGLDAKGRRWPCCEFWKL